MLVAGEETNESLSTWLRAAAAVATAAHESSESERRARRQTEHGLLPFFLTTECSGRKGRS